jgi:hypothetical protein
VSAHVQDQIPGLHFSYRDSSLFVHCYMHGKKKSKERYGKIWTEIIKKSLFISS